MERNIGTSYSTHFPQFTTYIFHMTPKLCTFYSLTTYNNDNILYSTFLTTSSVHTTTLVLHLERLIDSFMFLGTSCLCKHKKH